MTISAESLAHIWGIPIYDDAYVEQRIESFQAPSRLVSTFLGQALEGGNHQVQHLRKAAKLLMGLDGLAARYLRNPTAFQRIVGGRRIRQSLRSDSLSNEIENAAASDTGPRLATLVRANRHMLQSHGSGLSTAELIEACRLLGERSLMSRQEILQIATRL